jgi:GABA(A) receptor-associated protein
MDFINKPLGERLTESKKIIDKYPNRVPIIVTKNNKCKLKNIDKNKYLVPNEMTIGHFVYTIRKRLQLEPQLALFFFINNKVVATSSIMLEIYNNDKNEDGFLYITYQDENTFG